MGIRHLTNNLILCLIPHWESVLIPHKYLCGFLLEFYNDRDLERC
nr:MAG TPA: hypothetical protein [Caudoviricetes sp.]